MGEVEVQADLAAWLLACIHDNERDVLDNQSDWDHWMIKPSRIIARIRELLVDCESKRQIIAEHASREVASLEHETFGQPFTVCRTCRVGERQVVAPCPTLRLLARPYTDRPGYLELWRPQTEGDQP